MKTAIIIPARYGSTRFPGKPLAMIAGKTMLERVFRIAQKAAGLDGDTRIIVATDNERIESHAKSLAASCVLTTEPCLTGTDRVEKAVRLLDFEPDFVINFQGDAPLTPPSFLKALIDSFREAPCDVVTPVVRLSWDELDELRENKKKTPFSGTTAVFDDKTGTAYWFSKNVLPALRKEKELREKAPLSPVWRHIGLYGYSRSMLGLFSVLPESPYESLEGLEQLRVIENGYKIRCVPVTQSHRRTLSGIDSPEDVARAEAFLAEHGEP